MEGAKQLDASPAARGKRLRELREALRFSRNKMAADCNISSSTIQSWETARYGGLTSSGADVVSQFFKRQGLEVSPVWLLFESGDHPLHKGQIDPVVHATLSQPSSGEKSQIQQELRLFSQHCEEVVDIIVPDNGLAPIIEKGDYVAGQRYFNEDIKKIIGRVAIVQLVSGEMCVRILQESALEGCYDLYGIHNVSAVFPVQSCVELFSAAEVRWIRKIK